MSVIEDKYLLEKKCGFMFVIIKKKPSYKHMKMYIQGLTSFVKGHHLK